MGPEAKLAAIATRHFPVHHTQVTLTAAGSSSVTFTEGNYHNIYRIISDAKVYAATITAASTHSWLPADTPEEFEVTPAQATIYLLASGVAANISFAKTGNSGK